MDLFHFLTLVFILYWILVWIVKGAIVDIYKTEHVVKLPRGLAAENEEHVFGTEKEARDFIRDHGGPEYRYFTRRFHQHADKPKKNPGVKK